MEAGASMGEDQVVAVFVVADLAEGQVVSAGAVRAVSVEDQKVFVAAVAGVFVPVLAVAGEADGVVPALAAGGTRAGVAGTAGVVLAGSVMAGECRAGAAAGAGVAGAGDLASVLVWLLAWLSRNPRRCVLPDITGIPTRAVFLPERMVGMPRRLILMRFRPMAEFPPILGDTKTGGPVFRMSGNRAGPGKVSVRGEVAGVIALREQMGAQAGIIDLVRDDASDIGFGVKGQTQPGCCHHGNVV